jgi:hypothetical protein
MRFHRRTQLHKRLVESSEVCLFKSELLRLIQIHRWRGFCSTVRVLIYFAIKYFNSLGSEVDSIFGIEISSLSFKRDMRTRALG